MRPLATLLRPDRRRIVVALALSSLIYLGFLGTWGFADDKSQVPTLYRWLWPLTIIAWPGWVILFGPLAWLSRVLTGSDRWVWDMGANPTGLVFSYLGASVAVFAFDRLRSRIDAAGTGGRR